VLLTTRHSDDFDILTTFREPAESPYSHYETYVPRVTAFYAELGVKSALWTVFAEDAPLYVETDKTIEYLIDVAESRIIAYVDEIVWSPYVTGETDGPFCSFSRTPVRYAETSILVALPLQSYEVKEWRRYELLGGGPKDFRLAECKPWSIVHGQSRYPQGE
jgi:hypothetical protein